MEMQPRSVAQILFHFSSQTLIFPLACVTRVFPFAVQGANVTVNPPVAFCLKITVTVPCAGGGNSDELENGHILGQGYFEIAPCV